MKGVSYIGDLMSKKSKSAVLDSLPPYGAGGSVDVNTRLKHQDSEELHQEVGAMRGELVAAKHRKLMLAAEVRFLRRRYQQLMETKAQEKETIGPQKSKNKQMNGKQVYTTTKRDPRCKQHNLIPCKGRIHITKEAIDEELEERTLYANVTTLRTSIAAFDLNQDSWPRPPLFDLNEVSTGEDESQKSLNEEQQLSNCGSGKRKISWQDPVALRV